jgi:hypothetical protein
MKIFFSIILILIVVNATEAQYSVRASMGIDLANTPSLNDFINQTFPVDGSPINDFNTAVNFSGEFDYTFTNTFQTGLELSYVFTSFTFIGEDGGKNELGYGILAPSLLGYYVLAGSGYNFKFGGGLGIRFVDVKLLYPGTTEYINYSCTGYGFILKTEGNTLLGGNVYANIGADLKYDINGYPKSNGDYLYNNIRKENVNLNSLAFTFRLGISYIF